MKLIKDEILRIKIKQTYPNILDFSDTDITYTMEFIILSDFDTRVLFDKGENVFNHNVLNMLIKSRILEEI